MEEEVIPAPVKVQQPTSSSSAPITTNKINAVKEKLTNTVKDIQGLRLHNPYLFQERLETRDPNLFLTLRQGKFDGYSRMCPSGVRRQPVILTKDELEEIAKDNSGALMGTFKNGDYDGPDALKYGSSPDKQFYYMCPRYWCLKTNTVVTSQQIRDGVCGGEDAIIPKNAKTVPVGKSIYQFYDNDTTHFPGFHKEETPNGLCIPCCYESWNKPAQMKRRAKCSGDTKPEEVEETKEVVQEVDEYIKGPEKFPLDNNRWGYLPFAIQKFLHEMNIDCQESKTNTNIKPNYKCLLRCGVQQSANQSFIACIANALFYTQKNEDGTPRLKKFMPNTNLEVPTIEMMKEIIIKAINIDTFITYQNGDLVNSFANDNLNVDESKYYNSKLYKKIQETNTNTNGGEGFTKEKKQFFKKVVQSFENFILFLRNKDIVIDYTYLWDIVCRSNPMLFESGINLIILEVLNNDITNNVELICPTNHYSSNIYDSRKRILILVKQTAKNDVYFEPIYSYKKDKDIFIEQTFSEFDPYLSKTLRAVFRKIIKPILKDKCGAFKSRRDYKFVEPLLLDNLIVDLLKKKYTVNEQVLNFQGKVIGVTAIDPSGRKGFIPCYPSSLTTLKSKNCDIRTTTTVNSGCNYGFIYMTDIIWQSYKETLDFLKEYYKYSEPLDGSSGKCIDGTDLCKVIEDKLIVGFLTKTNQFVQISPPVPEIDIQDNIRKVTNNNFLTADIHTQTNHEVDTKRVEYIKRIELETTFYNVFRTTIRILLNDYINSDKRKQIQEESNNRFLLYDSQLEKIISLLKDLCEGYILFASKEDGYNYDAIENIYACISLPRDKCNSQNDKKSVCMFTNDKCSIILPKENLITGTDNEVYYYGKMADELIRYNRIKTFIFQPQSYLSFEQLTYNLREDEMIILQSLLTDEFFENLIPSEINKYAKYNTYDNTEPIISQAYSNEVILEEGLTANPVRDCFPSNPEKISTIKWKKCFPTNYKEINYTGSKYCAIYLVIDIIKQVSSEELDIQTIKDILFEEYKKLTNNFKKDNVNQIADILIEQGKMDEGNQLKFGSLHILEMIMSEGYFFTNFDLWILLVKYKIQSIFLSSYRIPETRFNDFHFPCYVEPNNNNNNEINSNFVFIIVPAIRENIELSYKLIVNPNNNDSILIDINMLVQEECKTLIKTSIENTVTIEEFMEAFKRDKKTKYKQRKPGVRQKIAPEFEVIVPEEKQEEPIDNVETNVETNIKETPPPVTIVNTNSPIKKKRVKKLPPKLVLLEDTKQPEAEIIDVNEPIKEVQIINETETTKQNKKTRRKRAPVVKSTQKKAKTKKNIELVLIEPK